MRWSSSATGPKLRRVAPAASENPMNNCRNCGAQVPPEKAWCPQCNEPVEVEARRTVQREMDSFAGTLIKMHKPAAGKKPVDSSPIDQMPVPAPTPPRGPATAANPVIATGQMPVVPDSANSPKAPVSVMAEPAEPERSRPVIYVAVGLGLGVILLIVMIVVAIILWNSSR